MLTGIIVFNSNGIDNSSNIISDIGKSLTVAGISIDGATILSIDDINGFKMQFTYYFNNFDNVILLNDYNANFDINSVIADITGVLFCENKISLKYAKEYCEKYGLYNIADRCKTPDGAIVIPNENGAFQPYYFTSHGVNVFILPNTWKELKTILDYNVVPVIVKGLADADNVIVYKLFGDDDLVQKIEEFTSDYGDLMLLKTTSYNDITAVFVPESDGFDAEIFKNNFECDFYEYIYSDDNSSLAEKLLYYLNFNNFTLGVAESFTGGRVSSSIVKISGASAHFNEGIVAYSNDAKMERLNVSEQTLDNFGAVSEQTAKEMVECLLKANDFAISTTGIAGPKSDSTLKPVGLCYVSAGVQGKIVTKELRLFGDRETITELGKNNALFLAVKQLQQLS